MDKLKENGFLAYTVGGCVRDSLIGKEPVDWDICTNALPHDTMRIFSDFGLVTSGEKHGTIGIILNHKMYEITTFRTDGDYLDSRHPEKVLFVSDINSDLERRDFTINAMAYNHTDGLVDPFGGVDDLKNKIIHCVGTPDKRFLEDALRIMRALRFSAALNFKIEKETAASALKFCENLKKISVERIKNEFSKLLLSDSPSIFIDFEEIFKIFTPYFNSFNPKITEIMQRLKRDESLRLCAYILNVKTELQKEPYIYGEEFLRNLKYDKKTIKRTVAILKNLDIEITDDEKSIRLLISSLGYQLFEDILEIKLALTPKTDDYYKVLENAKTIYKKICENKLCCQISELEINGHDLKNENICDAILIKQTLQKLIELVITGDIKNSKEELVKKAKEINTHTEG